MEERNRVVKNRSSSGCLIIKKKLDGVGSSGKKVRDVKRARFSSSGSSEDEEEMHGRRGGVGVVGMSQGSGSGGGPVVYRRGVGGHGDYSSRINDFDDLGFGMKRSKLDIYDFDEYDDLSDDAEGLGMRHFYGRETVVGSGGSRFVGSSMRDVRSEGGGEFESGSSKGDIIYKRRNSIRGGGGMSSGEKMKVGSGDEAIRLQGKNGVLKVRVKPKEGTPQLKHSTRVERKSIVSRSQEFTPKNVVKQHSPYSERKLQKRPMGIDRVEIDQQKKRKSLSVKSSEESDEESDDGDTSPKLHSQSAEVHLPMKRGRSGGALRSPETPQPVKLKEGKVKRGSGTEKQLLREKIRNMLVSAGWTIDYRPRRGRDYSDAVYVNPSGTAYWSIIKAYDALQKQLEEEGNARKAAADSSSFAPLSDDILSKLTRQTKKKIEKELKRKKREEGKGKRKKGPAGGNFGEDESDTDTAVSGRHDDKLSSFIKRSGKSLKGASREGYRSPNPNGKMPVKSGSNSRFIHGRKSKKIGRCTLLIRSSDKGLESENDGYVPYTGKRNLLSWLIDSGTVKLSEKVHYMNRRRSRIMLEGWITRDGIHCGCCSKILSISKFEIHAASKLRQPFQNVYVSTGLSLLQCQVEAWNRQDESLRNGFRKIDVDGDDPNDDTCAICGDGGNLICCDGCPSTFHQNCLDIQMLPPGDWHCPHCSCKFCGLADVSGPDENDERKDVILTCSLCEGKYHSSCAEDVEDTLVNSNASVSFCGKACQELFECLQRLLGVKHELEAGLCWSLIHRTTLDSDPSSRGYAQKVEWNSKLAIALSIMDECFLPIVDRRSGINMIHNVLYNCGSNFTRLNYSGFYTAILERGDEIISAASIRIRGTQFAEMPFIGTRHIYRRQGMCRRLFSAIESALRSLKVEKLIIPAISELMETWTTVFGFSALGDADKQEMKTLNMMAFPGTDMLQKKLSVDQSSAKKNLSGVNSLEDDQHKTMMPDNGRSRSASPQEDDDSVKDKPITDVCMQDQVVSFDGASPNNKKAFSEMKSAVLDERGQGRTASSSLLYDLRLNEAPDDEKLQTSPDAMAEQEIGKYLNDSPVRNEMEESPEHKLAQDVNKGEDNTPLPLADVSTAGTSDNGLSSGFLRNDDHASNNNENVCSKNESIAEREKDDVSEETHDNVVVETSMIEPPAEGNTEQSREVTALEETHNNVAVETPMIESSAEGNTQQSREDTASEETRNNVVAETPMMESSAEGNTQQSREDAALEETHNNVVVETPMIESSAEGNTQQSKEDTADGSHEIPSKVDCSGSRSSCVSVTADPSGSEMVASQTTSVADKVSGSSEDASHVAFETEDPRPDSLDENANQPIIESKLHDANNNNSEVVSGCQAVSGVSCENPAQNGGLHSGDVDVSHAHDTNIEGDAVQPTSGSVSCEISSKNSEDVGLENPQFDSPKDSGDDNLERTQFDSSGGSNIPVSEGVPHETEGGISDPPVISNSCEATAHNVEAIPPSEKDSPSLTDDGAP